MLTNTNKRLLLNRLIAVIFLIGCSNHVYAKESHTEHQLMESHGMVLIQELGVGLFASHLPLYVAPHNYQIIYKVDVSDDQQLKKMFNIGMVTALPKNFNLSKLIIGESFVIETKFYQGHFERGGKLAFTGTMTFTKQLLAKKVVADNRTNQATFYSVAVSNNKILLVHKIHKAPSFDAPSFDALAFVELTESTNNVNFCFNNQKTYTSEAIRKQLAECGLLALDHLEVEDFKR